MILTCLLSRQFVIVKRKGHLSASPTRPSFASLNFPTYHIVEHLPCEDIRCEDDVKLKLGVARYQSHFIAVFVGKGGIFGTVHHTEISVGAEAHILVQVREASKGFCEALEALPALQLVVLVRKDDVPLGGGLYGGVVGIHGSICLVR